MTVLVEGHEVPRSLAAVTPEWLTVALSESFPGVIVSDITIGPLEHGTNQRAAVMLRYRAGSGPERVFIKGPGRIFNRLALLALGAWDSEARLVGSKLALPLEHAAAYATGMRRTSASAVVVLEDITLRGGRPNDPVRPLTVAEVEDGLAGLARLHAAYWGDPPDAPFVAPWRLGRALAPVSAASLAWSRRRLQRLGRADLVPARAGTLLLERQFREWTATATTGPQTLLHGDPHPGNTYALPSGRTGFYDWQLVRTGNWAHDVGYFLVSSLAASDRKAHERALLDGYLAALVTAGVPAPAADDAWRLYRQTPAFGLCTWLHTLAGGGFQPLPACLAVIARFAAAYEDLATATL